MQTTITSMKAKRVLIKTGHYIDSLIKPLTICMRLCLQNRIETHMLQVIDSQRKLLGVLFVLISLVLPAIAIRKLIQLVNSSTMWPFRNWFTLITMLPKSKVHSGIVPNLHIKKSLKGSQTLDRS